MIRKQPIDISASIRERLYNLARQQHQDFGLLLSAYAVERILYRLGCSEHADRFVLKGARLFALWTKKPYRPTRDLDLLGLGDSSPDALLEIFESACRIVVPSDGMEFDHTSITIEEIRLAQAYSGQRLKLIAHLDRARIPMQIDIGFGDVITPEAEVIDYGALLEPLPHPRIRAYPRETVIAEKLQTMVTLGDINTRMKDIYDLWILAEHFEFDGQTISDAIRATFERRRTSLPQTPPACLQSLFAEEPDRQRLWRAFLKRIGSQEPALDDFKGVHALLRAFLSPPLIAAGKSNRFPCTWSSALGWDQQRQNR